MTVRKFRALALALLLFAAAFVVVGTRVAARPSNGPEPYAIGPRIDEIVVAEELDLSKALTEIIAGNFDTIWFDLRTRADAERAMNAPEQVDTFAAYGLFDEFTMNPAIQTTGPANPFAIRAVRESMQYLIDRDFIVRDIYGGTAIPYKTPFHPRSPDYGRNIADFLKLEDRYAFNPEKGKTQMFTALQAAGWTIAADGFWHDPSGQLVTIKGLKRVQDQRLQLGGYYEQILGGLNFNVQGIGVTNAAIPYGSAPDENIWHYYTAGWIATSLTAWDDGQLHFYSACGIGQPFCGATSGFYVPPVELNDIAEKLAFGQYTSLTERQQLIARGTDLAMQESLMVFIDARQSTWVNADRIDGIVWDLFGGNTNPWSVKASTVPADGTGFRQAKILNFQMFVDGWNPWVSPGWLYDGVQRDLMVDPGMSPHPHTGRWINFRQNVTAETAGPTGSMPVPTTVSTYDASANAWVPVASGTTAVSKVTADFIFGKWHHGQDITMDDVMASWANIFRRVHADGDIEAIPGVENAGTAALRFFINTNFKGIRVVDSDTIEVYIDYWHADMQEIAAFGVFDVIAPWEVLELASQMLLNQTAVANDGDIAGTGRLWLDLTKGDSIPHIAYWLSQYKAANHIAPGMATYPGGSITTAEATARWAALESFEALNGHYWPSNGPFYLASVDTPNRQTIFRADRVGYPLPDNYWDALTTVAIPSVSFAPTPPVVFAGSPAIFDFTVTVGPSPTDAFDAKWFLRDVSTGEFLLEDTPDRLGTGTYRVEVPSATTDVLLLGNFEVITVVTGHAAAVPTIARSAFLILPSTEWFEALLDARADLIEQDLARLSGDLSGIETDIDALASTTSGLVGLVTAMAILSVIAVVVAVVSVVLTMRRGRSPPAKASDTGGGGESGEL